MKTQILFITLIFIFFSFVSPSRLHSSFLAKIGDPSPSEEMDFSSPFSPMPPSVEIPGNLADINPVENSLQISTMTNQFTNTIPETKKPIVKEFPQDNNNYIEIRKNFKEPEMMHVNYYINSVV